MRTHPTQCLELPASVVTIGAFDGVHLGHRALISRAKERARRLGVPGVVYTFDPPPKAYFVGATVLTPLPRKVRRLEALGVDHAVIASFDHEYAGRGVTAFVEELGALNPREVWVGPDFRFGSDRSGGIDTLGRFFEVRIHEPVACEAGEVISSSRVRELLARGFERKGEALLGWGA